jgi:hypothetical protein
MREPRSTSACSRRTQVKWWAAILCVSMAVACGASPGGDSTAAAAADQSKPQDINHLEPRRDSVGPRPARFAWTAVANAGTYSLNLWNEVDMKVFEQHGLTATSAPWPDGLDLPLGTYFWAVVAVRDGRPVAESGLSAFVITE